MTDQRRSRPCEWISAASAVASFERRLASQTPARRIAHTHARTGRYCGTRWMRLEAGNKFAHLPQSGFKFELSEAEETEKGSKKKCIIAREREKERRGRVGTQANWVAAVVGLVWVLDLAQSAEAAAIFRLYLAFIQLFFFFVLRWLRLFAVYVCYVCINSTLFSFFFLFGKFIYQRFLYFRCWFGCAPLPASVPRAVCFC